MINHIENLEISSYRGIRNLRIDNLGGVNIFVGDNNAGKTSVLEAIQFFCAPNKYNLMLIARQREKYKSNSSLGFVDSLEYLFDVNCGSHKELEICGQVHGNIERIKVYGELGIQFVDLDRWNKRDGLSWKPVFENSGEIETFYGKICRSLKNNIEEFEVNDYSRIRTSLFKENIVLPSQIILTVDHMIENAFNKLISSSMIKEKAVMLLQEEFENNIVDLRIIGEKSRYIPVVEIENGQYIPLDLYGDGMKKVLTMLNAIVNTEKGVVLIDEFETGLHTSVMEKAFSFIIESALKSEVQLFMTTHSLEAVDKLLESSEQYTKDIRIIRLRKKNGKVFSSVMNGCEALENRREYDLELRV